MPRQVACRVGIAGPTIWAMPGPIPGSGSSPGSNPDPGADPDPDALDPSNGTVGSAVPWTCITDVGAGLGQSPSCVAATGPIAANSVVSQAIRKAIMPPADIPAAYVRPGSSETRVRRLSIAALTKATSLTPCAGASPQQPPPTFHAAPMPSG